ncbi:hypothetical protein V1478_015230 [Vespula squamosa]|uniref:Uncharacterized protein n=1 Tax=Vespula squamosa TaxID=30214 RepID=A0ABD2A4H9_VESSQ
MVMGSYSCINKEYLKNIKINKFRKKVILIFNTVLNYKIIAPYKIANFNHLSLECVGRKTGNSAKNIHVRRFVMGPDETLNVHGDWLKICFLPLDDN